jgi:hypothetical protein
MSSVSIGNSYTKRNLKQRWNVQNKHMLKKFGHLAKETPCPKLLHFVFHFSFKIILS